MKNYIKWKILIITCAACLLPIPAGLLLRGSLPDSIAIHFDIYNNPDNYASKDFVIFGLPVMMVLLQLICCVINDINAKKYGDRPKFEKVTKWIIPLMTVVLQGITFAYALGVKLDIRKWAVIISGLIFLVIGNYLPKMDYIKNSNTDKAKSRKINRFIGFESVIMGILAVISAFLPPVASLIWIFLLIPYAVIATIYSVNTANKK